MKLVDVHCHLNDSRFSEDLDEVLKRFREKGGEIIVTSGVNKESNREALGLAKKYNFVKASFGIYPVDALAAELDSGEAGELLRKPEEFDVDEELAWIEGHAKDCVAIGEIGLDYNFKEMQTEEMRAAQKEVFRKCLRLAKKLGKVVVIHSRKAEADAIEILEEESKRGFEVAGGDDQSRGGGFDESQVSRDFSLEKSSPPAPIANASRSISCDSSKDLGNENSCDSVKDLGGEDSCFGGLKVVMHCFSGKKALIRRCVENGWSFSVPCVITRLEHFKMLVGIVPLEQILTETDGAYLAPVAGTRNEPANVLVTLEEIARIKGMGAEEVAEAVWENYLRVFAK